MTGDLRDLRTAEIDRWQPLSGRVFAPIISPPAFTLFEMNEGQLGFTLDAAGLALLWQNLATGDALSNSFSQQMAGPGGIQFNVSFAVVTSAIDPAIPLFDSADRRRTMTETTVIEVAPDQRARVDAGQLATEQFGLAT